MYKYIIENIKIGKIYKNVCGYCSLISSQGLFFAILGRPDFFTKVKIPLKIKIPFKQKGTF